MALLTCVPRWAEKPPRVRPTSIFNDLASIGERMREIQEEERRLAPNDLQASKDDANAG